MAGYLIFASRDPFSEKSAEETFSWVESLGKNGDEITLFLVENGALAARRTPKAEVLTRLAKSGARVWVDELSAKERGIEESRIAEGIEVVALDKALDALGDGAKTFWT
jgi:sulfur relay (sulfurtransferase) DsrF/TusC family protein